MSTARDVISRSFRMLGLVKSGDSLPEASYQDALTALNSMIDGLRNDNLVIRSTTTITIPLVIGTSSYTLGASGASVTVTNPPTTIENILSVYTRQDSYDYQCELLDIYEWGMLSDKAITTADIPTAIYFNGTSPNSTVNVYPIPSKVQNMYVEVWTPHAQLSTLSTTFSMPPGVEEAITYNLALRLAPEYPDAVISQYLILNAKTTLDVINKTSIAEKTDLYFQPGIE